MSKYIIEIAEEYEEYFKGVLICGIADGKFAVDVIAREDLEELNSDYINEHYGELQDEAYQRGLEDGKKAFDLLDAERDSEYQRGYEDGKKSVEDEGLRNNINLIVTQCGYSLDEINDMIQKMRDERQ